MNLDNKYSKLQVYNKKEKINEDPNTIDSQDMNEFKQSADEDENDLADFLGDLPEDQV